MARTDWQIRAGTYNSGDMGTSYAVVNFPAQTDMTSKVHWKRPVGDSDVVKPTLTQTAVSGDAEDYGGQTFTWIMPYLTADMIAYISTNVFNGNRSGPVTLKTLNRKTWTFEYKNATGIFEPEKGDPVGVGYANVPITFIKAEATAS